MSLFAFDDRACSRLAREQGTPTFAYRSERLLAQVRTLRGALPSRVRLAYAVKANPLPQILICLAQEDLSFDCASAGELDRLASIGVSSDRIFFAGPGKRDAEIETAVARAIRLQAEGIEDLLRVQAAARAQGKRHVAVNLRVQPLGVADDGILGGSGPTAFGVDEEDLPVLLAQSRRFSRVSIRGVHGFAASNERSAPRLLANHRRMMIIAQQLATEWNLSIDQIDLGGGLGVAYNEQEEALDLGALGVGLESMLAENPWFRGQLILEPGRFLVASCGVYLARVLRIKHSRGVCFTILDGGINHLLRPFLTGQPFPVRRIEGDLPAWNQGSTDAATSGVRGHADATPRSSPTRCRSTVLAGPLCTALDRLGEVELPSAQPGDLLVFGMTGAYGATEAMTHFLSHPPASEVWVSGPY